MFSGLSSLALRDNDPPAKRAWMDTGYGLRDNDRAGACMDAGGGLRRRRSYTDGRIGFSISKSRDTRACHENLGDSTNTTGTNCYADGQYLSRRLFIGAVGIGPGLGRG
jgi:hypothetical protein